jgi:hypothetical protein
MGNGMANAIKIRKRRRAWLIVLGSMLVLEDIDVAFIRGAYTIKIVKLDKTGVKIPVPFFSAEKLDLSVEWSAISWLNRFEIIDGEVHYRDFYSSPKVNIFATSIHILAENLS